MNITSAKYANEENNTILIVVEGYGNMFVPPDPKNIDYVEIMRQVDAGTLTIEPADD